MLTQLPEANMHFYSKWLFDFAGVEFGTESEAVLTDMVRFIVVNVLPSNEIIQSTITQRYQLIS
jgi:integrator complex subunit 3